jgi:hypothetical protein
MAAATFSPEISLHLGLKSTSNPQLILHMKPSLGSTTPPRLRRLTFDADISKPSNASG